MATRFAVLLGVAAAAQPREWSVILDAPSRWAKPLSQASVSRELAVITFVMFIYQAASTPLCVVMPLERAVVLRDYRNGVFSTAPYWLARGRVLK